MKITKEFTIDLAHRLTNYNGKCFNVHWHTYKIVVWIEADINEETWMVMDFNNFKTIKDWCDNNRDHAYVYAPEDKVWAYLKKEGFRVFEMETEPTAEYMSVFLKGLVASLYNLSQDEVSITVYETPTSYATA